MMRLGIAGLGGMGQNHLRNYLRMPDRVRVTALADPVRLRDGALGPADAKLGQGEQSTALPDARWYDDYRELCESEDVDVVCIAMPSDHHADAAVAALDAGKHVFTEKPMALSDADCRRMLDAAGRGDRVLMVGHVLRFWAPYVTAWEVIDSGRYGRVVGASMRRFVGMPGSGWFADPARSGGPALDLHIHDVDTALWFWGAPDRMDAGGGRRGRAHVLHSRWSYDDGPSVQFECYWDAGTPFRCELRVVMEQATLLFDTAGEAALLRMDAEGVERLTAEAVSDALLAEDEYFLACAADNAEPVRCRPSESMAAVRLALETARRAEQ
ncbi:MAG: Gfo/Idh/MocA family protein [Planctomycetota bacterium]